MGILGAIGSLVGAGLNFFGSQQDRELQKDAMTHSIRWKVNDAKAAGIHPLYALGAPTFNPAPVGVGGAGDSLASLGANLDDVLNKRKSDSQAGASRVLENLTLERAGLENDLLRSQIRKINAPGLPPAQLAGKTSLPEGVVLGTGGVDVRKTAYTTAQPVRAKPFDKGVDYLIIANPRFGQNMEDDFSDIGGNIMGGPAIAQTLFNFGADAATAGPFVQDPPPTSRRWYDYLIN